MHVTYPNISKVDKTLLMIVIFLHSNIRIIKLHNNLIFFSLDKERLIEHITSEIC